MTRDRLLVKYLIRHSGRLILFFMLSAMIIGIMFEPDYKVALVRTIPMIILSSVIFFTNVCLLSYYHARKAIYTGKTGRKIFVTGYLLSIIYVSLYFMAFRYLCHEGILFCLDEHTLKAFHNTRGWRAFVYLPVMSLLHYAFIFLIQNNILHQYERSRIEMELLKLKTTNAETANQLLRQQIQPHFLFNALNILKSLIKKYPQTAEAYLLRLSDFLRASVTTNTSGIATVKEELKVCNDYMEMQKIRFGDALRYTVEIPEADEVLHRKLPFFSLQPLLENAIKHNELTEAHPLEIRITREGDRIIVTNNRQVKKVVEHSTGNGLSNLKERYRILAGGDIKIDDNGSTFSVSLKML